MGEPLSILRVIEFEQRNRLVKLTGQHTYGQRCCRAC